MTISYIPQEVIETALQICKAKKDNFPEDDWECLKIKNREYDLNLWTEDGHKHATLYTVADGMTDVSKFWCVL